MRDSGYGSLTMEELVNARDHGVTPEYVRELGEAGHRKLPLQQLIRVRDHGVGGGLRARHAAARVSRCRSTSWFVRAITA